MLMLNRWFFSLLLSQRFASGFCIIRDTTLHGTAFWLGYGSWAKGYIQDRRSCERTGSRAATGEVGLKDLASRCSIYIPAFLNITIGTNAYCSLSSYPCLMWDASSERGAVGSKADTGCIPRFSWVVFINRLIKTKQSSTYCLFLGSSPSLKTRAGPKTRGITRPHLVPQPPRLITPPSLTFT